jgi:hypothetical protein
MASIAEWKVARIEGFCQVPLKYLAALFWLWARATAISPHIKLLSENLSTGLAVSFSPSPSITARLKV